MTGEQKYYELLSEKYPSVRSLTREIINLTAILNLPKGTEHFMSDIHGEYEAFCHILNNCSGVIREKVEALYGGVLSHDQIKEICTLIYYPSEKLSLIKRSRGTDRDWYRTTLEQMIEIARVLSSKYTRSKVRKAMPPDYAYIIDELLRASAADMPLPRTNTTISCIVTNAKLTKAEATKVAQMSADAYAHTILPTRTTNDGDTIFVMATGGILVSSGGHQSPSPKSTTPSVSCQRQ